MCHQDRSLSLPRRTRRHDDGGDRHDNIRTCIECPLCNKLGISWFGLNNRTIWKAGRQHAVFLSFTSDSQHESRPRRARQKSKLTCILAQSCVYVLPMDGIAAENSDDKPEHVATVPPAFSCRCGTDHHTVDSLDFIFNIARVTESPRQIVGPSWGF